MSRVPVLFVRRGTQTSTFYYRVWVRKAQDDVWRVFDSPREGRERGQDPNRMFSANADLHSEIKGATSLSHTNARERSWLGMKGVTPREQRNETRRMQNPAEKSRQELQFDSTHTQGPSKLWMHRPGSVSQSFQRSHNPGTNKQTSTEYTATLGRSLFSPIWSERNFTERAGLRAAR